MKTFNRRQFLRMASLGMSALAVQQFIAACGIRPTQITGTELSAMKASQTTQVPPSPSATEPPATQTPLPADLVIVHGKDPESLVRKGIDAIGGMAGFVKQGANVIIKPNVCVPYNTYEYASTTNPWVVGTLVKLCFEAGASQVRVMDNPFGGPAQQCYEISGIAEQVANAGGEMEVMQALKFKLTDYSDGVVQKRFSFYQDFLTADAVINVPIAKHHGSATLTLGMKNLMGTIEGREYLHSYLHESIVDLASYFKPTLTVLDAVRILMANGPTGGRLNDVKEMDTIAISQDIVAVDSYGTSLFGLTPADVHYVQKAMDRGLGIGDLTQLKVEEINSDA